MSGFWRLHIGLRRDILIIVRHVVIWNVEIHMCLHHWLRSRSHIVTVGSPEHRSRWGSCYILWWWICHFVASSFLASPLPNFGGGGTCPINVWEALITGQKLNLRLIIHLLHNLYIVWSLESASHVHLRSFILSSLLGCSVSRRILIIRFIYFIFILNVLFINNFLVLLFLSFFYFVLAHIFLWGHGDLSFALLKIF